MQIMTITTTCSKHNRFVNSSLATRSWTEQRHTLQQYARIWKSQVNTVSPTFIVVVFRRSHRQSHKEQKLTPCVSKIIGGTIRSHELEHNRVFSRLSRNWIEAMDAIDYSNHVQSVTETAL